MKRLFVILALFLLCQTALPQGAPGAKGYITDLYLNNYYGIIYPVSMLHPANRFVGTFNGTVQAAGGNVITNFQAQVSLNGNPYPVGNVASGGYSWTENENTTASGGASHAEGENTTASGNLSHAEGNYTTASGQTSHAAGVGATASADYSFIWSGDNFQPHYNTKTNSFMIVAPGGINLLGGIISGNGSGLTNLNISSLSGVSLYTIQTNFTAGQVTIHNTNITASTAFDVQRLTGTNLDWTFVHEVLPWRTNGYATFLSADQADTNQVQITILPSMLYVSGLASTNWVIAGFDTNGAGTAAALLATNHLPASIWTLGTASQSNANAFDTNNAGIAAALAATNALVIPPFSITNGFIRLPDATNVAASLTNSSWLSASNLTVTATNGSWISASNLVFNATNNYVGGVTLTGVTNVVNGMTNGWPWGSLYDPANAAYNSTNGYPWGSLYDAANSALNATNNFGNSVAVSLTNALNDYTGSNITASGQLYVSDTLNGTVNSSSISIGSEFNLIDAQTYSSGTSLSPHVYGSYAGLTANPTNNITGTASRKLIYTGVGAYYAVSYAPVAKSTNSMYGDMYGSWFFAAAGNAMASTNSIGYGTYLTAYGFTTNYGVYVYQATGQAAPSNYFGTNISVGNYVGNGAGLTNLTSVIQQGSTNAVALTSFTATFSQPFVDTNYTAVATGNGFALASSYVSTKTVSSCVFNMTVATGNIDWMVVHQ